MLLVAIWRCRPFELQREKAAPGQVESHNLGSDGQKKTTQKMKIKNTAGLISKLQENQQGSLPRGLILCDRFWDVRKLKQSLRAQQGNDTLHGKIQHFEMVLFGTDLFVMLDQHRK